MARVKTWLVVVAGVMAVALSAPATRASKKEKKKKDGKKKKTVRSDRTSVG
jgi:hypothetical protein